MKIRKKCPQKNNKYYNNRPHGGLSDAVNGYPMISGLTVLDNCVGWANSRFNEIINDPDLEGIVKAFKYQLVCNAENFIESAKRQGLKISSTPIEGGIMVWQKGSTLGGGDGAGHVAVVERVYDDGSILTSESGWASWTFKNVRRYNDNGRWGQNNAYRFRGCIINPAVKNPKVVPAPKLTIDGIGGACTVRAMQRFFGVAQDGVISGQNKNLKEYYPSLTAVDYDGGGSITVKKLQKWVGAKKDGVLGEKTVKKWQKKLGLKVTGKFGKSDMKVWQEYLNNNEKAVYPRSNIVIDVSEFQSAIDWDKVKADGIQGVIVRCGYRGAEKGTLNEDSMFLKHIKGAYKAGLKVGTYMFTEGINADEGREEARYAIKMLKKADVPISYPIAVDSEAVNVSKERARNLSVAKRTSVIKGFCKEIIAQGYEPMIYASTSWLNNKLDMSKLPYDVWVAQYASSCDYKGKYVMWQYTSTGKVSGVKGDVDKSHCYLK